MKLLLSIAALAIIAFLVLWLIKVAIVIAIIVGVVILVGGAGLSGYRTGRSR